MDNCVIIKPDANTSCLCNESECEICGARIFTKATTLPRHICADCAKRIKDIINKEHVDSVLKETIQITRIHHTPLPLVISLTKDLYSTVSKEYWSDFQEKNPDFKLRFFSDHCMYSLDQDGELVICSEEGK